MNVTDKLKIPNSNKFKLYYINCIISNFTFEKVLYARSFRIAVGRCCNGTMEALDDTQQKALFRLMEANTFHFSSIELIDFTDLQIDIYDSIRGLTSLPGFMKFTNETFAHIPEESLERFSKENFTPMCYFFD